MEKRTTEESPVKPIRFRLSLANKKEREAFIASMRKMDEQSGRLGILDPTDAEPAILYFAEESKR